MPDAEDLLHTGQPEELMYKRWKTDQLAANTRIIFVDKDGKAKDILGDSNKSSVAIDEPAGE